MKRINYDYFKLTKELPLLMRAQLKIKNKKEVVKPKKILVIDPCVIGDFLATLPALRTLIKKYKVKVDLVVSPPLKGLAENIIGVNEVFTSSSSINREIERVNNDQGSINSDYDLVVIMRISKDSYTLLKNIKSKKIKSCLKPYLKFTLHLLKRTFTKQEIKQWRDVNFELIGEEKKDFKLDEIFHFDKSDYSRVKKLPEMNGNAKKIIIHTGSGWKIKLWNNKKWIELLKMINRSGKFKFIFVGNTSQEREAFAEIQKNLDFKIYSLIDKINLKDLMIMMRNCNGFIGVDSGPRNMAHLVDLPSVNLLGPGPKFFMPMNKKDVVIDKSHCRCLNIFCYKRKTCLERIEVNEVFSGFQKIIKRK